MTRGLRATLLTVLALGLLSSAYASVAAAEPPDFGLCTVPLNQPYGSGEFEDMNCTKTGGVDAYVWHPKTSGEFFISKGKTTFATSGGTVTCSGVLALGYFTSSKTIAEWPFRFSGCKLGSAQCTSSGAAAGEVRTSALVGTLGFGLLRGKGRSEQLAAGVQLTPPIGAPLAQFGCGATTIVLRGAPVAPIVRLPKVRTLMLEYKVKGGIATMRELSDVPPEPLEASLNGGPFAPAKMAAKLKALNYDEVIVSTTL
jgi:hypothetical protein